MKVAFSEHIVCKKDAEFISSSCDVEVDSDGYFVKVETCPYEGSAMFTLPVARKVYEALGRGIEFAEKVRASAQIAIIEESA